MIERPRFAAHLRLICMACLLGFGGSIVRRWLPKRRTASDHPLQYYLALPWRWKPTKTWPILVVLDGVNRGHFIVAYLRWMVARSTAPVILVIPCIVSNGSHPRPRDYPYRPAAWHTVAQTGPLAFDTAGVLTAVRDVQAYYHGAAHWFVTGYSAGGHLAWYLALEHPEQLAGVALAATNYAGRGITAISTAPERTLLPIRAWQGDHDRFLTALNDQWMLASTVATTHGYRNLRREMVAGAGHRPFARQVLAFVVRTAKP